MRRLAVMALAGWGLAVTGLADVVLDQSFEGQTGTFSAVNSSYSKAQTFTVGTSGYLDHIELRLFRNTSSYALIVDVRPADGSGPAIDDGSALATATIGPPDLPYQEAVWYAVDLSAAQVQVQAGQMLAITLRSNTSGWYGWEYGGNGYAAGQGYSLRRSDPEPAWTDFSRDHSFRTYVAVPEPGGPAGLLAATVCVSAMRRTRSPA